MEEYLRALAAFLFFSATSYAYCLPLLVTDLNSENNLLPKRLRMIDKDGMKVIGSGQFSKAQLLHIQRTINGPMMIIDLRQESHGFVNDLPISWYGIKNWENKDKLSSTIESQQTQLLAGLEKKLSITVYKVLKKDIDGKIEESLPETFTSKHIYSEQQLAKALGLGYKRFYIADHSPPDQTQIRAFHRLLQTLPQNTWLYIHCRGGSGRTTTFMAIYEIYKLGKKKSLQQILQDQTELGGKNLAKLPAKNNYKYPLAVQRLKLIKQIYSENKSV